jgi:hypothetical protein
MAIAAKDGADRVAQLITIAQTLTTFAEAETAAIAARRAPSKDADQGEMIRLANAFRIEMGHIDADPSLIATAPKAYLGRLRRACTALEKATAAHRDALAALKLVSEGLLQAMAEEVARQRGAGANYGAAGTTAPQPALAVALDKRA